MENQVFWRGNPGLGLFRYIVTLAVNSTSGDISVLAASRLTHTKKLIDITGELNYARAELLTDDAGNQYIANVQVFVNGIDVTSLSLVQTVLTDTEPPENEDNATVGFAVVGKAIVGQDAVYGD